MSASASQCPPKPAASPPARDRDALFAALHAKHGAYILELLRRYGAPAESSKDLRQRVLMTLCAQLEKGVPVANEQGYLRVLVKNEASNYKQLRRRQVRTGADADTLAARERDPEGQAVLDEEREKLDGYLGVIPPEEAAVVRCIGLVGLTIAETAVALGRPPATVADQYDRATTKLHQLAVDSARATRLATGR